MKIFLTGASGTGKTTVGKLLSNHYDLPLQPSISRTSPFKIGTVEHQEYISNKIFELAMTGPDSVFDRAPLDIVGYDLAYGFPELSVNSLLNAVAWAQTKPLVIYFPVYWEPEDDGFRPTDEKTTSIVDLSIKTQLEGSKINHLTMPDVNPASRLTLAVDYINSMKENEKADLHI
jgi:hypothetical protein